MPPKTYNYNRQYSGISDLDNIYDCKKEHMKLYFRNEAKFQLCYLNLQAVIQNIQ